MAAAYGSGSVVWGRVTWRLWAALSMASVGSGEVDEPTPAWPKVGHSPGRSTAAVVATRRW